MLGTTSFITTIIGQALQVCDIDIVIFGTIRSVYCMPQFCICTRNKIHLIPKTKQLGRFSDNNDQILLPVSLNMKNESIYFSYFI